MSQNTIKGNGTPRSTLPIPKDVNGTFVAAVWDQPLVEPRIHYELTIVQTADIDGVSYVTGSAGRNKTIKAYETSADTGDDATLYTYKYQDSTYPTKITDLVVSDSQV